MVDSLNQIGVKSGKAHECNVVLLLGDVLFPLLPFLAVVRFSVVYHSCVVFFSPSSSWVLFASSLSFVGGVVFSRSSFWVRVPSSASLRWCCSFPLKLNGTP